MKISILPFLQPTIPHNLIRNRLPQIRKLYYHRNYGNKGFRRFANLTFAILSVNLQHPSATTNPIFAATTTTTRQHHHHPNPQLAGLKKMEAVTQWDFSCDLEVDYKSEEKANIIYLALAVDKELQPDKVRRLMSVSNGKLSVHFEAVEARFLRASYSAFVDVLTLATKTIEQFGTDMELYHA